MTNAKTSNISSVHSNVKEVITSSINSNVNKSSTSSVNKENGSDRNNVNFKKSDVLEFNNKKSCGLWLVLVGSVLGVSILFGGRFLVNPFIFLAGYYISFYIANVNAKIRKRLSQGSASPFQIKMIFKSIALLFILMFCIAGPFIPQMNFRMIWLGVNLATGIHFFPFYFVHGRSMILLGILCTVVAICGYVCLGVPVTMFFALDAIIKFAFGVWMLFFSKPTKSIS